MSAYLGGGVVIRSQALDGLCIFPTIGVHYGVVPREGELPFCF